MMCTWCPKDVPPDSPSDDFCQEECQRGWSRATDAERAAQAEALRHRYWVECSCGYTKAHVGARPTTAYSAFGYLHNLHRLVEQKVQT